MSPKLGSLPAMSSNRIALSTRQCRLSHQRRCRNLRRDRDRLSDRERASGDALGELAHGSRFAAKGQAKGTVDGRTQSSYLTTAAN
jgi:hypothetical protein